MAVTLLQTTTTDISKFQKEETERIKTEQEKRKPTHRIIKCEKKYSSRIGMVTEKGKAREREGKRSQCKFMNSFLSR